MSIQHDYTLNPVTALHFFAATPGPFILAGEGCYLKVFDSVTCKLICEYKVFESQIIHGIVVQRHNNLSAHKNDEDIEVVVWGGSSLCVFSRRDITTLLHEITHIEGPGYSYDFSKHTISTFSDWVIDVAISPHAFNECVLVTAHNTILRATFEAYRHQISLETLSSPSRSVLYSAHLIWESENTVLVAAGTVFGEIIVWQCSVSTPGSRVLHTFTGHEGSIFGVKISLAAFERGGSLKRLLASCSDDRTIRIWEISLGGDLDGELSRSLTVRETGFGGALDRGETSNTCVAMVMGHMSRIWGVEFLVSGSTIYVLSFGEDATTQLWLLEDSKLIHLKSFAFNTGKHIWSRAINHNGNDTIATGGADGKISLFEILTLASNTEMGSCTTELPTHGVTSEMFAKSQSWDLEAVLAGLSTASISTDQSSNSNVQSSDFVQSSDLNAHQPVAKLSTLDISQINPITTSTEGKPAKKTKPKKAPKDVMNRYAFVSEGHVLMTTTFGRVLVGELDTCVSWKEVKLPGSAKTDLRSYSVVKSIPTIGHAYLGCANGNIFLYRQEREMIQYFGKVSSKVADMFAINHDTKADLLVTTLGDPIATLFEYGTERSPESTFSDPNEQILTLPERFIVTSAGKTKGGLLVLGSRQGSLAIYDSNSYDKPVYIWTPNYTLSCDAITSIVNIPETIPNYDHNYFLTTCRDGSYSILRLSSTNGEVSLVHQGTPPFGPMIEAAWFSGTDLMLYGFKSKHFIVWNESKQYEVSTVECGGAHRSIAYSPREGSDGAGHFVYTKASKLHLHSQSKPSHQIIKAGGHGREIKACAVSDNGLIATGAEDTVIRLWRYERQFECVAVVQKQTTGIQHLQWHGSNYLFSSGGNEEFFVWAVESIPGFGIGMVCEATCPDQSEEKDLRIMSFDVSELGGSTATNEIRLLISLAFSDSTIRVYTYSKSKSFQLVSRGRYTSSCLMQLRHLELRGHEMILLVASTDGNLSIWKTTVRKHIPFKDDDFGSDLLHGTEGSKPDDFSRKNRPSLILLSTHRVHQSSIKSLDMIQKDGQILVATGGDDNALAITTYRNLEKPPQSVILRSVHAAAITGLSFVPSQGEEVRIVTSGNDQRVKEWGVHWDNVASIRKMGDVFTSVADVGDLASLCGGTGGAKRRVLVVGNGMEVYDVSREP